MKLEIPIIALLLSALIFTGLYQVFISDLGVTYGADMNLSVFKTANKQMSMQDTFDKINATKTEMDTLSKKFEEEQVTDSGSLFGFLKLTWTIGKQTLSSVNIMKELSYGFASILGIPSTWITVAISILLIILVISIIMVLAGRSY